MVEQIHVMKIDFTLIFIDDNWWKPMKINGLQRDSPKDSLFL